MEETQPYNDSRDLSFETLVLKKPEYIICIAKVNVWLRYVLKYSRKPLAFRIATAVKAMTENTNQDEGMPNQKSVAIFVLKRKIFFDNFGNPQIEH